MCCRRTAVLIAAVLAGLMLAPGRGSAAGPPPFAREVRTQQAPAQEVRDGIAAIVNDEVISIGEVRRTALLRRDARAAGLGSTCGRGPAPIGGEGTPELAVPSSDPAAEGPGRPADLPADAAAPTGAPTRQELVDALDCLIDATLVFREVRRFPQLGVDEEQVDALMAQLEAAWASPERPAGPDAAEALDAGLRQLGLLRSEVRADLHRQLLTTAYIDTRFRATVDISDEEARRAWSEELAPGMRARGIEVPPYEQVAGDLVVPLLREREVNRRVQSWIGDLRTRATIDRRFP